MDDKHLARTDAEWRSALTKTQYAVTRRGATEPPFSGEYCNHHAAGTYLCVCCGTALFSSADKFDSRSGWPSYTRPATAGCVHTRSDLSHLMVRTEVLCAACDAHLGHVFEDGPQPSGLRYCINSAALRFAAEGAPEDR